MTDVLKGFSIAGLKADQPYLKLIEKTLNSFLKSAQQKVESIAVEKAKRIAGVSVAPVQYTLSGQQALDFLLRADGDVYRVKLNGKDYPLTGDLNPDTDSTFKAAIKELARAVITGQAKFTAKLEKESNSLLQPRQKPNSSVMNIAQQLKANADLELQLDNEIVKLTAQRDELKSRLDGLRSA